MSHYLTIDQGNTAAKAALWRDGELVDRLTLLDLGARQINGLFAGTPIDTAIYCSVRRRPATVLKALERRVSRVMELTVDTPLPLAVDYSTPSTLGVDRLAAAVGAYSLPGCRGRDLLVVDMGTAITYDHVSAGAVYRGGNIAPGIRMRLKALHHYTARLPLVEAADGDVPLWGFSTQTALRAGAVRGVVAEIEYYRHMLPPDHSVVLTGGCAPLVARYLGPRTPALVEPDLVALGLNRIITFNNEKDL